MKLSAPALALALLAFPAVAQDILPVQSVTYAGRLDAATGRFLPAATDGAATADSSMVLYDNTTTNGYLATGAGAITTMHYMDWGTLTTTGGQGATITEIRIGYATNLSPAQGAPSMRMRLYQGATGLGLKGNVVLDMLVPALPIGTGGPYEGFTLDVVLPSPVVLSDGPIGWSYNVDPPPGAPLPSTGALLVGPPNGPGAGAAHGPLFGSYDRYSEATDAYVSTTQGTNAMLSLMMRLTGREGGGSASTWSTYGSSHDIALTGEGSATPGSSDNVIHVESLPPGKPFVIAAGATASSFLGTKFHLHFQVWPWLGLSLPIVTDPVTGKIDLPMTMPATVPPGSILLLQAFGQGATGQYTNWSQALQCVVP